MSHTLRTLSQQDTWLCVVFVTCSRDRTNETLPVSLVNTDDPTVSLIESVAHHSVSADLQMSIHISQNAVQI